MEVPICGWSLFPSPLSLITVWHAGYAGSTQTPYSMSLCHVRTPRSRSLFISSASFYLFSPSLYFSLLFSFHFPPPLQVFLYFNLLILLFFFFRLPRHFFFFSILQIAYLFLSWWGFLVIALNSADCAIPDRGGTVCNDLQLCCE